MKSASEHLDVSTGELETLLERARQQPLEPDGYEKLKAAIRTLGYVTELLENREATLETLRRLLCQSSTVSPTDDTSGKPVCRHWGAGAPVCRLSRRQVDKTRYERWFCAWHARIRQIAVPTSPRPIKIFGDHVSQCLRASPKCPNHPNH